MTYDFTTVLDRAGRDIIAADLIPFPGVKVEEGFSTIPMWVADMSFPTAPEILAAMRERGAAYGLSDEFITTVFTAIHEESVRKQNEILEA